MIVAPGEPSAPVGEGHDAVPLGSAPIGRTESARVVRVIDGDTIVIDRGRGEERVRYIGIDSPEVANDTNSPAEWMSRRAKQANADLVQGRMVILERDVSATDRFGRLLRYVWLQDEASPTGWVLVNLVLVSQGYAEVTTYPPDVRYVDLYLEASGDAAGIGVGLWGAPPPTPEPTLKPPKPEEPSKTCHPSYKGACLKTGAVDYDCAGGSGDGPLYVAGPIRVVGYDEYDLDRDGDGVACEPY